MKGLYFYIHVPLHQYFKLQKLVDLLENIKSEFHAQHGQTSLTLTMYDSRSMLVKEKYRKV